MTSPTVKQLSLTLYLTEDRPPTAAEVASLMVHEWRRFPVRDHAEGFEVEFPFGTVLYRVLTGDALAEHLFGLRAWCASAHPYKENTLEGVLKLVDTVEVAVTGSWHGSDVRDAECDAEQVLRDLREARKAIELHGNILLDGAQQALMVYLDPRGDPDFPLDDLDDDLGALPLPSEVVRRAYAVLAIAQRGHAEEVEPGEAAEVMADLRRWMERHELFDALEPEERALFDAPIGSLDEQQAIDMTWQLEAAAVLAWALELKDLPAIDEMVDPVSMVDAFEPLAEGRPAVLDRARLRPLAQIEAFNLRQMTLGIRLLSAARGRDRGSRQPEAELGLELEEEEEEVLVDGGPIDEATEDALQRVASILQRRQQAAMWLVGMRPRWCDEGLGEEEPAD